MSKRVENKWVVFGLRKLCKVTLDSLHTTIMPLLIAILGPKSLVQYTISRTIFYNRTCEMV